MEKVQLLKVTFENCGLDYDYTYVHDLNELKDYLEMVEPDLTEESEEYYKEHGFAKVTIEPVFLTSEEYGKFLDKLEETA